MPDDGAARHLRAIARGPRFAGSVPELDARAWCRAVLTEHGFAVTEEAFSCSTAVARWSVPLAGGILALALSATAAAWRGGLPSRPWALLLTIVGVAVALLGMRAARRWVLTAPMARLASANLVATRGTPTWWLVAHLDTKSQPMPTLVRAGLLLVLGLAVATTVILGGLWPAAAVASWPIPATGTLAGLLLTFATIGNASPGAADNASGVAAVLRCVELLPDELPLGIVLPSGEELALAGMRAWTRGRSPGRALNIDTIDDAGGIRCMVHGTHGAPLAPLVVDAARATDAGPVRVSGLLPGVLTDGVALADAGWRAVTISRGTLGTLARIHRPADSVGRMTGTGAETIAQLLHHVIITHR